MYESWKGRWKVWARGGSGRPTLLFLHGFTGDAESWRDVIARLEPGRNVFTLTLPGHEPPSRRSALAVREPEFDGVVDRLLTDLERIAEPPFHIVGYSMGARVALGMLLAKPEWFDRATLVGVHAGIEGPAERRRRAAEDRRWIDLLEKEGLDAFVLDWERRPLFSTQTELPADMRRLQRAIRTSHDPHGLAWSLRVLGLAAQPSYWDRLYEVETPVDLVAGTLDDKFLRIAERMERKLSRSRVVAVADCGHNVPLERPDVIADLIEDRGDRGESSRKRESAERKRECLSNGRRSSGTRTSATRRGTGSHASRSTVPR